MKEITGVLVNPAERVARKATIPATLEGYYAALGCSCIDIVTRKIGGKAFDIVCDDEALLKADPVPSACNDTGYGMLYGALFICGYAGNGELASLTDDDCLYVLRHVNFRLNVKTIEMQPILTRVDYP